MKETPKHLNAEGGAFWAKVRTEYAINDAAGLALLTAAAVALDRMVAARKVIQDEGEIVKDRYKQSKVHPACTLEKDSRAGFLAAMRALQLEIGPPQPVGRPTQPLGWKGKK